MCLLSQWFNNADEHKKEVIQFRRLILFITFLLFSYSCPRNVTIYDK